LRGIMSRKNQIRTSNEPESELKDIAKFFVPAPVIANFIPAE
jgi:hypothetical protein